MIVTYNVKDKDFEIWERNRDMYNIVIEVKANVGDRQQKVRIISRDEIESLVIEFVKNMTIDEVKKYGKSKGWNVSVVNV
mgnify:CR=1 FL=1